MGPFFAWQIICDLVECNVIDNGNDFEWVLLGPGAKAGLDYIFSTEKKKMDHVKLCQVLREMQRVIFKSLNLDFLKFDNRHLSLKEIEHALCEFHKYVNATRCSKNKPSVMRAYKQRDYNHGVDRVSIDSNNLGGDRSGDFNGRRSSSRNLQQKQQQPSDFKCDDCNRSFFADQYSLCHTCDTC